MSRGGRGSDGEGVWNSRALSSFPQLDSEAAEEVGDLRMGGGDGDLLLTSLLKLL